MEPAPDEAEGLVALGLGYDGVGLLLVPLDEPVLEGAQPEEVVVLLQDLYRGPVDRTQQPVQQLGLGVVLLTGDAVEPAVRVLDDPAVVVDLLEELLHRSVVPGLGGADEVIVADVQLVPHCREPGRELIGPLLGGDAMLLGGPGDLLTVLVRARQEEDVITGQPVPAGQRIGIDRGVGVADVRGVVDVVDRGRDVEAGHRR